MMADPKTRTRFAWWPVRLWGKDGSDFVKPIGWVWFRPVTEVYADFLWVPAWVAYEWRQP